MKTKKCEDCIHAEICSMRTKKSDFEQKVLEVYELSESDMFEIFVLCRHYLENIAVNRSR